jgi:long-chain fatty acid transport protein
MRKLLTFIAAILITGSLFAGGLVTNTNQSALFTRLQNRNASTSIDAVYFNPAGLTNLGEGFFVSINNQTIGQEKSIKNNYTYLAGTPREFIGKVSAPLFPGVYMAYNFGKISVSAGFNPVGGGGGAKYSAGLPSFETKIADLVPLLASQSIPTTQYSGDIYFEGSSVYFGYQANVAYKISDQFSIAAGVRLVSAKNTYSGYLRNIKINPNYPAFGAYTGGMVFAKDFFNSGATVLSGLASSSTTTASTINGIIGGGTPAATPLTAMPAALQTGVAQLLGAAGISTTGMNIGTAAATLSAVAPQFSAKANTMLTNAGATSDIDVDAEETGTGITPIVSVNITPSEKLNIAIRYEYQTTLDLTQKVNDEKSGGIFIDGKNVVADMPALLATGVDYKPMKNLSISASLNIYFDKMNDYDGGRTVYTKMIDKNFYEYGLGAEYGLSDKLRVSAGWVATSTGVNSNYQNDQRYSTNTNSFGAGIGYRITPKIDLNIGGQYTVYQEGSKDFKHMLGTTAVPVTETYNKSTWIIGAGLDFYFGKKE